MIPLENRSPHLRILPRARGRTGPDLGGKPSAVVTTLALFGCFVAGAAAAILLLYFFF